MEPQPFLCKKGNYRELAAYQKAETICSWRRDSGTGDTCPACLP